MTECVDLFNLREAIGEDAELERELFEEFIISSQELVNVLRQHCLGEQSDEAWRTAAHALKGISYNLGANGLGELSRIAQESFELDISVKRELWDKINTEYNDVVVFLQEEVS